MTTVSAVSSNAQLPQQQTNAAQDRATLIGDMNTFLQLLTTQLQNQDPTSPMDTNQFTEQLTQYAGIEQQITTNDNLENLIALQSSDRQLRALDYVGSTIESVGDTNRLVEGQDVQWIYALNDRAEKVNVQVRDLNGEVVYSEDRVNEAGRNEFTWDGTNIQGEAVDPGNYYMVIQATDGNGDTVGYTPGIRGVVDSIDFGTDTMYARIGDIQVNFDTITNVKRAGAVNAATGTGSGS